MAEDAVRTRLVQNVHELRSQANDALHALDEKELFSGPLLYQVWRKIDSYQPGDDGLKAAYLIGEVHQIMKEWAAFYEIVESQQGATKKLAEYDMRKAIENG